MQFEDLCFVAKILVWKAQNWQSQSLVDINFSFPGNRYKSLVCVEEDEKAWYSKEPHPVMAVDYRDFVKNPKNLDFSRRKIVIVDMNAFEEALADVVSKKVSWHDFIYAFKQIYDPISGYGRKDFKEEVEKGLAEVDLFFGLATMNFKKISQQYAFRITSDIREDQYYKAIVEAAHNFLGIMVKHAQDLNSFRLMECVQNLQGVIEAGDSEIVWIEAPENRLVFHVNPQNLEEIAQKTLQPFKKIVFTASLGSESLKDYFLQRLGLTGFDYVKVGQQGLRKKIEVIIPRVIDLSPLLLSLSKESELPAAVLVQNGAILKDFYEKNFKELQAHCKVWAQNYSGGAGKLLENFGNEERSLLIATDNFILKNVAKRARVKTLVMSRLPFEVFTHPLLAAQAEKYQNQFVDFSIPRALNNFHNIIKFFYSEDLERIYILDSKIHKEYGKYFIQYIESLPFVEIKYQ